MAQPRRLSTSRTMIQRSRTSRPSDKALVHQFEGAGRRRVLRPFFELGPDDERVIQQRIDQGLARALRG